MDDTMTTRTARLARFAAASVVTLALIGGLLFWLRGQGAQAFQPAGSQAGKPAPLVRRLTGETVRAGDVTVTTEAMELAEIRLAAAGTRVVAEKLPVSGTIEAGGNGIVKVTPRVAGKVVSLSAMVGDAVRAGQTLGMIESTEMSQVQASYRQATARVAVAENNLQRQRKLAQLGVFGAPAVEQARKEVASASGEVNGGERDVAAAENEVAEAESEVATWEAEALSTEADVASARSEVTQAESGAGRLRAALTQAEAQVKVSQATFSRQDRLLQAGVTSRQQWEQAQADHQKAQADVEATQADIRQGQAKIETAQARLRAAQAKVRAAESRVRQAKAAVATAGTRREQAEAKLAAARNRLQIASETLRRDEAVAKGGYLSSREIVEAEGRLQQSRLEQQAAAQNVRLLGSQPGRGSTITLVTPIAGRVHERNASIGETVDPEHPAFTVINLDLVWAQLAVPSKDLSLARMGQRVELTADTAPGRTFTGTISAIGSVADEKTRSVRVRCALVNRSGTLRPDTFVRGNIITDVRHERVVVPIAALQEHNGKPTIYVARGSTPGAFEVRHVKLGVTGEGWQEISDGLKPGERIAVKGTFYLKSEALKSSLSDGCCAVG